LEPGYLLSHIIILFGATINSPDFKIIIGLLIVVMLLLGSALISGSEIAYFSLSPGDLRKLRTGKSKKHEAALRLYNMP
jgi:CBS domain containing-hemolysin-like protein